mmetsp:Transcript_25207/g.50891  ORF Transcript_25207/g.50891 Transcript_25207/m.50891 type:complete len:246 (-) Transcript_25207:432-1169(-)
MIKSPFPPASSSPPPPLPPPSPLPLDDEQAEDGHHHHTTCEGGCKGHASHPVEQSDIQTMTATLQQIAAGQQQQTQLIKNLQKSLLTTRSMVNEIIMSHNEMREELESLKRSAVDVKQTSELNQEENPANPSEAVAIPAERLPTNKAPTVDSLSDAEIDAIIQEWSQNKQWPPHCALKKFASDANLVKVRFHRSVKHQHMPVKIPAKEGTDKYLPRPCVLCSEGKAVSRFCSYKKLSFIQSRGFF